MKKTITSLLVIITTACYGQTTVKLGSTEQKINDALCECISKLDLTQINGQQEGTKAYTDCIAKRTDLLMQLAQERKVEFNDEEAMSKIGIELAKNLLSQNCSAALQLAMKMSQATDDVNVGTTQGTFKRIETKGFNYIVIAEANKGEKSFLWLGQFPDSEKFMGPSTGLIGKKLSIKWKEIEVYLPEAKGYYKVKEITEVDLL